MRVPASIRWGAVAPVLCLLLVLSAGELAGQSVVRRDFERGSRTGIGYAAVIPEVMAGVSAWHFLGASRFGIFADAKTTYPRIRDDGDFCPVGLALCTLEAIELDRVDVKLRDVDEYLIFNVGGIVAATPEIAFLFGVGPVRRSKYREYSDTENDPEFLITTDGSYWVPFDPEEAWTAQFVVGTLIRLSDRVVLRFGYERAPGGMSLGGYFTTSW